MGADDNSGDFGLLPGEARPQRPVTKDWAGQVWEDRPDVIIRGYVRNVAAFSSEDLMTIEGKLAVRDWNALEQILRDRKGQVTGEDELRLGSALEVVDKVRKPGGQ